MIKNKSGLKRLFLKLHFSYYCIFSSKLQAFIVTSNSYRVQSVLHRVNQTNRLRREVALLYGKVKTFDRLFFADVFV
jgi:hypothetical protein